MPEPIVVRRVDFTRPNEAATYIELLDAYGRDPMGGAQALPAEVRSRLGNDLGRNPAAHALIARRGTAAVGVATCFVGYSTFLARPLLNIHDIAVIPKARGRGIGTALLEEITALGRRLGCCKITLEVREDNLTARQRYTADGFQPAACNLFLEKTL